jgi:cytoskeletal protein CcmA (bactofilin family)
MWSLFRRGIPEHAVDNLIGEGTTVRGDLKGPGGFRIDGTVRGAVVAEGAVVIGDKGVIEGTITARDVVVLGRVHGDVTATGHLEVGPAGWVLGDVTVRSVKVHAGGVFHGASKIGDAGGEARLKMATNPIGLLPSQVPQVPHVPQAPASETKAKSQPQGRTLPPPVGAVPPPPMPLRGAPPPSADGLAAPVITKSHERIAIDAPELKPERKAAND